MLHLLYLTEYIIIYHTTIYYVISTILLLVSTNPQYNPLPALPVLCRLMPAMGPVDNPSGPQRLVPSRVLGISPIATSAKTRELSE